MGNELIPTEEEARLLELLTNEWWQKNAPARGIEHTKIEETKLTKSGIVSKLVLTDRMTLEALESRIGQVRTLLNVMDEHQTNLLEGGRAAKVALAIRTRRVTDTMNMLWHPGIETFGVDTVTGDEVDIPYDFRLLLAGASGSGKSWAMRPLMARSVIRPDRNVILIDGKGEEANAWSGVCRTAVEPAETVELVDELHDDMFRRKNLMKRHALSMWDTRLGPVRLVFVDEGRVVLSRLHAHDKQMSKMVSKQDEGEGYVTPSVEKVIDLSSLGRSRGIVLIWGTQYPTTSGNNPGIDPQINVNIDARFCLRVRSFKQAQVILDDDAIYGPHRIPSTKATRGYGYKGEHGPNLIRTWTVTDEVIQSLKEHGGTTTALPPSPPSPPQLPRISPQMDLDRVRSAMGNRTISAAQLATQFGADAREVSRILTDLMIRGEIGSCYDGGMHLYGKSLLP